MQQFVNDYMEGAAPEVLDALVRTNMEKTVGYGLDPYCESAREKIRATCKAPEAEIHFLVGGTQTNETVLSSLLRPYEGVIAVPSAHIAVHEAGAIEHGGHKVLVVPGHDGKLTADAIRDYVRVFQADANNEHEVWPGAAYISQPTEYGTLYTLAELEDIRRACDDANLKLYIDGARLGYALAAAGNDVSLPDLARLADVFYIGGTKVGCLFGEAVVFPKSGLIPHFYTITKIHGGMLAKGRLLGIQFDTLFTDNLYERLGAHGDTCADRIRAALAERGYELFKPSTTNQVMVSVTPEQAAELAKRVEFGFMEALPNGREVIRFCTSWATCEEDVDELISLL